MKKHCLVSLFLLVTSFQSFSQVDFMPAQTITPGGSPRGFVTGNFDGSGDKDLAYTLEHKFVLMTNEGNLKFDTVSMPGLKVDPFAIAGGDLNNDGVAEIILFDINPTAEKIVIISHGTDGFTFERLSMGEGDVFQIGREILIVDINSDGRKDCLFNRLGWVACIRSKCQWVVHFQIYQPWCGDS